MRGVGGRSGADEEANVAEGASRACALCSDGLSATATHLEAGACPSITTLTHITDT